MIDKSHVHNYINYENKFRPNNTCFTLTEVIFE
jgi:hypothetical protein